MVEEYRQLASEEDDPFHALVAKAKAAIVGRGSQGWCLVASG
jgi:hypothetical protein